MAVILEVSKPHLVSGWRGLPWMSGVWNAYRDVTQSPCGAICSAQVGPKHGKPPYWQTLLAKRERNQLEQEHAKNIDVEYCRREGRTPQASWIRNLATQRAMERPTQITSVESFFTRMCRGTLHPQTISRCAHQDKTAPILNQNV
eukprot:3791608-Amphidinium_carterae.1